MGSGGENRKVRFGTILSAKRNNRCLTWLEGATVDIRSCRELITVADKLSFSDAAEELFVTQPTLSKHVAATEREVGFRIFDRDTAGVDLTAEGALFIDGLRDVVDSYDATLASVRSAQNAGLMYKASATVRVAGPLLNSDLSHLVATARNTVVERGTPLTVPVRDVGLRDSIDLLFEDKTDILLAFSYGAFLRNDRRLRVDHLTNLPFGISCYQDHPLASLSHITFDDIRGQTLLTYPLAGRAGYHDFMARVCRKHGIDEPHFHCDEYAICAPLTSDQVVFGVYFPGYATMGLSIVSRPLDDARDAFDLCIVRRRREPNPYVRSMFDALKSNNQAMGACRR